MIVRIKNSAAAAVLLACMALDGCSGNRPDVTVNSQTVVSDSAETAVPATFVLKPFSGTCSSLGNVPNPTYDQLVAVWDRISVLQFQVLMNQTKMLTGNVSESDVKSLRETAIQGGRDQLKAPTWRSVVNSIPAGGVGRQRVLACELGKLGEAGGSSDLLSAVALEPYYALATFGYHSCVLTRDYPDETGAKYQKELCPR